MALESYRLKEVMPFEPNLGELVKLNVLITGRVRRAGDKQIKFSIIKRETARVFHLNDAPLYDFGRIIIYLGQILPERAIPLDHVPHLPTKGADRIAQPFF
jgi:hypothetical protein